ncbi:hypothetical protein PR048_014593 [Dryococelus australis]|uniref:Uncharacterized protein n=1 Tax=Dryococelus australis TaxID=614101 RepID=A0ABQ9HEN2_9NEOP|nr:hypothetical protein PR048_014593 [Dryococelus australis]
MHANMKLVIEALNLNGVISREKKTCDDIKTICCFYKNEQCLLRDCRNCLNFEIINNELEGNQPYIDKKIKQMKTAIKVTKKQNENYNLKFAEEIQSFHFGGAQQQISMYTVVVYIRSSGTLETKFFCTVSCSLQHNAPTI